MTYTAYLDEFGHIGPYISKKHPKHNDSPVFGLAGVVLPVDEVRGFATWFFQRKCELLKFEIDQASKHPAVWEKKGSSLYTVKNVEKYPELRKSTNRMLNKIQELKGFVFYVGIKKTTPPGKHNPNKLYRRILSEAIKRLDEFCVKDCSPQSNFILALDEHEQRSALITQASRDMFGGAQPRRSLVEPPFQLESHRYQTMQAADWIAGLIGRMEAYEVDPGNFGDNHIFKRYFEGSSPDRVGKIAYASADLINFPVESHDPDRAMQSIIWNRVAVVGDGSRDRPRGPDGEGACGS